MISPPTASVGQSRFSLGRLASPGHLTEPPGCTSMRENHKVCQRSPQGFGSKPSRAARNRCFTGLMRNILDRLATRFPGGPQGNRNLTALLGALLLAGTLVELATLALGLQQTLAVHIFVGVALIPVVALKLASTGWRMLRYYTRALDLSRRRAAAAAAARDRAARRRLDGRAARERRRPRPRRAARAVLPQRALGELRVVPVRRRRARSSRTWRSCAGSRSPTGRAAGGRAVTCSGAALVGFALVAGGAVALAALQSAGPWLTAISQNVGGELVVGAARARPSSMWRGRGRGAAGTRPG